MANNIHEVLKNDATSPLNGAINASVGTIVVDDGSRFPGAGQYRIVVDQETMFVTSRTTNTLTVARGHEGSAAAAHLDNAPVKMILTQGGIRDYVRNSVPLFQYPGRLSYVNGLRDKTGAILSKASFTNRNHAAGTAVTDVDDGILFKDDGTSSNYEWRIIERTYTTPITVIVAAKSFRAATGDDAYTGVGFVEDATNKLIALSNWEDNGNQRLTAWSWTNLQTFSAFNKNLGCNPLDVEWYKMEDDGATLKWSASHNGVDWLQVHSAARTTFFTTAPDRIAFAINCDFGGAGDSGMVMSNILVWDES